MNDFLQSNLAAIIVFLLLLVFLLMGVIIFILVKLVLRPVEHRSPPAPSTPAPAPAPELSYKEKARLAEAPVEERHYCLHHPDAPSVGSCLICEEVFCENCLIDHESMHFCKEHFRTFVTNKWKQITDVRTTPDTPEEGLYIYNFKRDLWINQGIPSFVMTHYKINIENDFIESFIQLNVREDEAERLSTELEKNKR